VTYVRVSRDQRGYETTFLLHARHPGDRPKVIYWYRTAPGVRVGRPAFDEEVIRTLEEQHPEIEFDWDQLMEEARLVTPEPERKAEHRRRPSPREAPAEAVPRPAARHREHQQDQETAGSGPEPSGDTPADLSSGPAPTGDQAPASDDREAAMGVPPNPLLEQLVGREIAQRLRRRYRELARQVVATAADPALRAAWQARAEALDPDRWETPEAVLRGVQESDPVLERLRQELDHAATATSEGSR
jgi:hypothetical protein